MTRDEFIRCLRNLSLEYRASRVRNERNAIDYVASKLVATKGGNHYFRNWPKLCLRYAIDYVDSCLNRVPRESIKDDSPSISNKIFAVAEQLITAANHADLTTNSAIAAQISQLHFEEYQVGDDLDKIVRSLGFEERTLIAELFDLVPGEHPGAEHLAADVATKTGIRNQANLTDIDATTKKTKSPQDQLQLIGIYTDGLADERIRQADNVLKNDQLNTDEKLWKIDDLMPIPTTISGEKLGKVFGVSKSAIQKTTWSRPNRTTPKTRSMP